MTEIYWLTRLAGIQTLAIILLIVSIIVVISAGVGYANTGGEYFEDERKTLMKLIKKWKSTVVCSFIFGVLGLIFIPTQREILLIYGLGSTIDYMKSNDKAKQLPDKAVDALTRYLDEIANDGKKESE